MKIIIECNNEQGECILDHFKNEHSDGHRYAYLMFDNHGNMDDRNPNHVPYILEIDNYDKENILINLK
jgi:hypothetical protein